MMRFSGIFTYLAISGLILWCSYSFLKNSIISLIGFSLTVFLAVDGLPILILLHYIKARLSKDKKVEEVGRSWSKDYQIRIQRQR